MTYKISIMIQNVGKKRQEMVCTYYTIDTIHPYIHCKKKHTLKKMIYTYDRMSYHESGIVKTIKEIK